MIVLGVDAASVNVGLVALDTRNNNEVIVKNTLRADKKLEKFASKVDLMSRFHDLTEVLKPDLVVIEGYAHRGHNLIDLATTGALLRYVCYDVVPVIEVEPTRLKGFIVGVGKGQKDVIMLEVFKRWGFEGTNDECDAYGLAMFGLQVAGIKLDMPKKNREYVRRWVTDHAKSAAQVMKLA